MPRRAPPPGVRYEHPHARRPKGGNVAPDGKLIQMSDCLSCIYWEVAGTVRRPVPHVAAQCFMRHQGFPDVCDCDDYEREPGSDDE